MGGFEEDARLARTQAFGEGAEAAGTVGVEQIVVLLPYAAHGVGNLLVGVGGAADVGTDGGMAVAVEVEHAGKVAGSTHVHGIGDGGDAGTGRVGTGLQVFVEDIVAVVGGNETLDGQPHGR